MASISLIVQGSVRARMDVTKLSWLWTSVVMGDPMAAKVSTISWYQEDKLQYFYPFWVYEAESFLTFAVDCEAW